MSTPDLGFLFETNPGPPSGYYVLFVALFSVLFVGGTAAALMNRRIFPRDALRARLIRRFGWYTLALGLVGLGLLIARYLGVPGLGMRFLLLLALAAVPALAAYVTLFMYTRYPRLAASYRSDQLERRYSGPVRSSTAARRTKRRRRNR